ncbi:hypothetical protein vBAmePPT11V19_00068 [Alteromonas phage vB_AmeP_PT11-V19]|nr:hypothetical protein vBAmePPT11V19_00068 [Alteromonas phage vB_AmeP_PT11-V19]
MSISVSHKNIKNSIKLVSNGVLSAVFIHKTKLKIVNTNSYMDFNIYDILTTEAISRIAHNTGYKLIYMTQGVYCVEKFDS